MKEIKLNLFSSLLFVFSVLFLFVLTACSQTSEDETIIPKLGVNYVLKSPSQVFQKPARHEVLEFFSYQCIHCFRSQNAVNAYLKTKPEEISYIKIPVAFGNNPLFSQIFYTFEELGELEKLHPLIFNSIHVEKINIQGQDDFFRWMSDLGYDISKIRTLFNSTIVRFKTNRSFELVKQYQVNSTPTFIIDGKYQTGPAMTNSHDKTMQLISKLTD